MLAFLGKMFDAWSKFRNKCIMKYYLKRFNKAGNSIYIGRDCIFTHGNISMGDHIYIGAGCVMQSAHGKIEIGNHVMFGPGVHIHGGNHIVDSLGQYMDEVKKELNSDGVVKIDDDVWIGSNAIILHGVHIGTGAVVGAGSIVTKDVSPYSIVAGNPAKCLRQRFDEEQLKQHKEKLNRNNQ